MVLIQCLLNRWRSAASDSIFRRWRARPWRRSQAAFTSSCFDLIKGSSGWFSFERKQMLDYAKGKLLHHLHTFHFTMAHTFSEVKNDYREQILKFTLARLPSSNLNYITKSRKLTCQMLIFSH